jgi:hypothetical protein
VKPYQLVTSSAEVDDRALQGSPFRCGANLATTDTGCATGNRSDPARLFATAHCRRLVGPTSGVGTIKSAPQRVPVPDQ